MAKLRYEQGVTSNLEVLDSQRNQFSAEQSLVQAQSAALIAVINLYKALGRLWIDAGRERSRRGFFGEEDKLALPLWFRSAFLLRAAMPILSRPGGLFVRRIIFVLPGTAGARTAGPANRFAVRSMRWLTMHGPIKDQSRGRYALFGLPAWGCSGLPLCALRIRDQGLLSPEALFVRKGAPRSFRPEVQYAICCPGRNFSRCFRIGGMSAGTDAGRGRLEWFRANFARDFQAVETWQPSVGSRSIFH